MFNKRPLIYIPKKKVVKGGGEPEVITNTAFENYSHMVLYRDLQNPGQYVNAQEYNYRLTPAVFNISPTTTGWVQSNKTMIREGSVGSQLLTATISGLSVSGVRQTLYTTAQMMIWQPPDHVAFTFLRKYEKAFYFRPGDSNVYRIKDTSLTNVYDVGPYVDTATDGVWNVRVFSTVIAIDNIEKGLIYNNITTPETGILVVYTGATLSDSDLLNYCNVFMQQYAGRKTAVVELDINGGY